jgi:hypothetical protein
MLSLIDVHCLEVPTINFNLAKTLVTKLILNHKNKTNKEMEKNKEVNLNVSHMH